VLYEMVPVVSSEHAVPPMALLMQALSAMPQMVRVAQQVHVKQMMAPLLRVSPVTFRRRTT
jgi:hypothetical protein